MTDKPQWVTDNSVNVDIRSLRDFSQALQREVDTNIKPNIEPVLARLSGQVSSAFTAADWQYVSRSPITPGNNPTFGIDARQEMAAELGIKHQQCEKEAHKLLRELLFGIQALAVAARKIADDYTSVDEMNSADMAVSSYFKDDTTSEVHVDDSRM